MRFNEVFAVDLHSIETRENTDLMQQIGKGIYIGEVIAVLGGKTPVEDLNGTITAFELRKPKKHDDRISLRFMPSNTVMQSEATFLCVPRETWERMLNSPLRRTWKPLEQ